MTESQPWLDGNVQAALLTIFAGIIGTVFVWVWRFRIAVDHEISEVRAEMSATRLQMAKEYATIAYLQQVESRMVSAIEAVGNQVGELRKILTDLLTNGAGFHR